MKKFLILLILLIILAMAFWKYNWPSYSWHQKMTIEIKQDGKIYSGSSVTSVTWNKNVMFSLLGQGSIWLSDVKGEAVVVELPGEKYLFAILSYSEREKYKYTQDLATHLLFKTTGRKRGRQEFSSVLASKGGSPLIVTPENYPFLVTFSDIDDPTTVKKVPPQNLSKIFGPDVEMKRITLSVTNEPVTTGRMEKVLEWLAEIKGRIKPTTKRDQQDLDPEENIYTHDFIRK